MLWIPGYRRKLLADRGRLGRWGEKHCEKFLKKNGYRFVARNFGCKYGEIDLVFMNMDRTSGGLVFVEVKTRRNERFRKAQAAVGYKKRKRIGYTAKNFVQRYKLTNKPQRFDVMAVILGDKGKPEVRHYINAFVP